MRIKLIYISALQFVIYIQHQHICIIYTTFYFVELQQQTFLAFDVKSMLSIPFITIKGA